jgi:hypothetical protein
VLSGTTGETRTEELGVNVVVASETKSEELDGVYEDTTMGESVKLVSSAVVEAESVVLVPELVGDEYW